MNLKKIIAATVSLTLVLTSYSAVFAATLPKDIQGASCEEAVTELVKNGAITGDTDGLFHPQDSLTRAQACIILVKAMNPQASAVNGTATQAGAKSNFSDLSGYNWATGYIGYAVQNGIVKGYPDGTFKPGNKVTTNEMLTMVLRASKYSEGEIGSNWPEDYVAKAKETGILNGLDENYPQAATKGMAAQMTFNQIDKLKSEAVTTPASVQPQGTNADMPKTAPTTTGMAFSSGRFDSNMTAFGGKKIAKNVTIYTYGAQNSFSEKMTLSTKAEDYRMDTVYKFRDVKTPAWYTLTNGEITTMILPRDAGFSGYVYGVVSGTAIADNLAKESVKGVQTLTATNQITWLCKKDLTLPKFTPEDGQLYELNISKGTVQTIATVSNPQGKHFTELTTAHTWADIYAYNNGEVRLANANGPTFTVNSKATIYVWDAKTKEYKEGTVTSINDSKRIRAYDISDNNQSAADIVILTDK